MLTSRPVFIVFPMRKDAGVRTVAELHATGQRTLHAFITYFGRMFGFLHALRTPKSITCASLPA